MPVGQSYKFVALSHSKDSAIIDLSEIYRDTTIIVELKIIYVTDGMKYNLQNANFAVGSHALNSKTKPSSPITLELYTPSSLRYSLFLHKIYESQTFFVLWE